MSGSVQGRERQRRHLDNTIGRVLGVGVLNGVLGVVLLSVGRSSLVFGYPAVAMMLTGPLLIVVGACFIFVALVGAGVKLGAAQLQVTSPSPLPAPLPASPNATDQPHGTP